VDADLVWDCADRHELSGGDDVARVKLGSGERTEVGHLYDTRGQEKKKEVIIKKACLVMWMSSALQF
jgi:hypothetical protein